jgi:hypothetical protein
LHQLTAVFLQQILGARGAGVSRKIDNNQDPASLNAPAQEFFFVIETG